MPFVFFTAGAIGIIMTLMAGIIYLDKKHKNNKQ